jgi:hypothetical protein
MSTQTVVGFAVTSQGGVPIEATITDGSDSQEATTDQTYTVTSQSLGTFAEGSTCSHLSLVASSGIAYGGILRNGQYIAVCQSLGSNALGGAPKYAPLMPAPVRLVAGDQIIVRTQA